MKYFVIFYNMDFTYSIEEFDDYEKAVAFFRDIGGYGTIIYGKEIVINEGEKDESITA